MRIFRCFEIVGYDLVVLKQNETNDHNNQV